MTVNLSGITKINPINLTGKSFESEKSTNQQIEKLKKRIVIDYMIPLYAKQWEKLNENSFFINKYIERLESLQKIYKTDDLVVYINLLKMIVLLIEEHNLLVDEESKNNLKADPNMVTNVMVKLPKIKLRPEYEIYNSNIVFDIIEYII